MNSFNLRRKWVLFSALAVGLLVISVISVGQQRGPEVIIEPIRLESAEGTLVFELQDRSVREDEALDIFEVLFGFRADLAKDEEGFSYSGGKEDPNLFFFFNQKTGELSFTRSELLQGGERLPGTDESFEKVLAFLKETGLAKLHEKELVVAHFGALTECTLDDSGIETHQDKLATLHIARQLEGRGVYGPGSKIIAHLNEFGIVGLTKRWARISRAREARAFGVQSPKEIPGLIETHLRNEWISERKIEVTDIRLVYYDDGMGKFIQPVYGFVARVMFSEKSNILPFDYLGFVPALVDPPEPVFRVEIGARGMPPREAKPTQGEED